MKNIYIIILILLSFVSGFFVSKIYFKNKPTSEVTLLTQKNEVTSGVYEDLFFQSLRKDNDNYYIKFSKQEEDKVFPSYCYVNGNFVENFDNGCVVQGRPMQEKIKPDIDLSKEYKFTDKALIQLITMESGRIDFNAITVSTFYKYLNNLEKPYVEYYGFILEGLSFKVTIINGEITDMQQIYKE